MAGDQTNVTGDHNIVNSPGSQSASRGGVTAGGNVSDTDTSGDVTATDRSTVVTGRGQVQAGFVEKAKKSRWFQFWGVLGLLVIILATIAIPTVGFSYYWAAYIVGVVAVVAGVVPLLKG